MVAAPRKRIVSASDRLYRVLLLCYPKEFRRSYRLEMAQTFRDCCQEALAEHGLWGVIRLWSFVLSDLAGTALIEHYRAFAARFLNVEGRQVATLVSPFSLAVAQRTDVGRIRHVNEDSVVSVVPEDPVVMTKKGALFVVADGMGGHTAGDVASLMAINTVNDAYYQNGSDGIADALRLAIKQANASIYQANMARSPQPSKSEMMGTTCVAAVLQGDTVYVANVGDSRAYFVCDGQIMQISQDHSIVAEEIRAGLITKDQARGHPQHNVITRCLGNAEVEIDIFTEHIEEGDLLVLCTDGLSNLLSDEELGMIVQQFEPQESVQRLVERANEQGGTDNITALVVRVPQVESASSSN